MQSTDQKNRDVADRLNLESVLLGLADDLKKLREGKISVDQAKAAAELSKQIMNGVRLVINAQKSLEQKARRISAELPDKTPTAHPHEKTNAQESEN